MSPVAFNRIDQDERPLNRASLRNEGKIHLGFIYANDRSLGTAFMQMDGALRFRSILARWLGRDENWLVPSTPFYYLVERLQRARLVARRQNEWWVPNRGVFHASAAQAIGGLRSHLAGEFSADWPWLLHMSLLGEFVRVPESLCTKILQPQSLSRRWQSGARSHSAVALSAMGAVSRAEIPEREKLVLHGVLAVYVGRLLPLGIRHMLGRWLRYLGLRRPRTGHSS